MRKAALGSFLARNPFPKGLTDGLFYREKMRAVHRIAPEHGLKRVLEIGGGRSGLAAMLYPDAEVITVDIDPGLAGQSEATTRFVCGDARRLPFPAGSFDAVTLLDVLEHVPEDHQAAAEALRVVRPGGAILVSTPNHTWRFPYYGFMRGVCRTEGELMAEWGHVRRGYAREDLEGLFGGPPAASASFINPVTAFFHDLAFSRLPWKLRRLLYLLTAPLTFLGYVFHQPSTPGTETAYLWKRA
ncbi:class I SAM-dependent methyltransferase [Caulobacter sp. 17J80-11]|uniref:class I SAM-dependent methyltransferase n=1 Tax=Caulobacter sp. 17J80-11 TaxID=2763502 RepID=UPI001653EA58|nr:class I SAM-dependent methyltransferase [Caulobacter sp. 17J80-11]MBC6982439.1 methyltransferase domain-containing protein [Caulobacter sp. 17J80-11]